MGADIEVIVPGRPCKSNRLNFGASWLFTYVLSVDSGIHCLDKGYFEGNMYCQLKDMNY